MLINQILQYTKRIIQNEDVKFIPVFKIPKSRNVIHHSNTIKDNMYMVILVYADKVFDKIQNPFIIKTQQNGYRGNVLCINII